MYLVDTWELVSFTAFFKILCSSCRFDEKFEGVLLAYEAEIIDKNAKILSGVHPYFGVNIKAKLLLFSPKPNMLLGWLSMILIVCEGVSFAIWSLSIVSTGKTTHLELSNFTIITFWHC